MTSPQHRSLSPDQSAHLIRYDRCIAHGLRQLRQSVGLTAAQVADRTGYEQDWLDNIESGTQSPTIEQLRDLALLYGHSERGLLEQAWAEASTGRAI
ncbi:helix-turn-helix domain-containing protein [Nocardia sp. NPDC051570]|uniref:helix-turn-helix domain-containing protein n=1 Tax=Nocardia sp. NPDC051570 TaxID=3364324 RepID=UPI00378CE37F